MKWIPNFFSKFKILLRINSVCICVIVLALYYAFMIFCHFNRVFILIACLINNLLNVTLK